MAAEAVGTEVVAAATAMAAAMAMVAGKAARAEKVAAMVAAAATAMAAAKAARAARVAAMAIAAEKAAMAGLATPEALPGDRGILEAARMARLVAIQVEVTQAQVAKVRATRVESAATDKVGARAPLGRATKAGAPPEDNRAAPEEASTLERAPVAAELADAPKAKATEATPVAIPPRAPGTEGQATREAAKGKVARGLARPKIHGAGTRVPAAAGEPTRPTQDPARQMARATAEAKRPRKAALAVAQVRIAARLTAKAEASAVALAGTGTRGRAQTAA